MEKTGEQLTTSRAPTNVTRMDYAAPLFNELVFSLATEELLGIEVPERASGSAPSCARSTGSARTCCSGHQRHGPGSAVGMMIYGWRESARSCCGSSSWSPGCA